MSSRAADSKKLLDALRSLRATGENGFEGLIRDLLTEFTGKHFRLARAGFQAGRDMSAGPETGIVIAVECKRFGQRTEFRDKELLGALSLASQAEVWVLAASRPVPDRTATQLRHLAACLDVELVVLDGSNTGTGPLLALCAACPAITVRALASHSTGRTVHDWLSRLKAHPRHKPTVDALARELDAAHIGFAAMAIALRARFLEAISDRDVGKLLFGQSILPRACGSTDIERTDVFAGFDSWWRDWSHHRDLLVVNGEEGTGKSWALASWLARRIEGGEQVPVVVWLTAQFFNFEDLISSVAGRLSREFPAKPVAMYDKRVRAWATQPSSAPRIVIVVDGLNERADRAGWQRWLRESWEALRDLPGAAVIFTSRSSFWSDVERGLKERNLADDRNGDTQANRSPTIRNVRVSEFTEAELAEAMAATGLSNEHLPPDLVTLVRRPRYFSIAARHWTRLTASGDFTRERLFFEEWRDRISARRQQELSDREFERLLIAAAQSSRQTAGVTFSESELAEFLPLRVDWTDRLGDLVSSGVFQEIPGAPGKYRLSRDRLYVGLGLMLLQEASLGAAQGIDAAVELVARALEPGGDAVDVAAIVRHSVCAALVSSGPHSAPREARVAILLALARQRNGADAWQEAAPWIYYPDNPDVIALAAEIEWTREPQNVEARERLAFCYSHIADRWPTNLDLVETVSRWFGHVHPEGDLPSGAQGAHGAERARFPVRLAEARSAVREMGLSIVFTEVPQREAIEIAPLAFLIASHGPHVNYVAGLVAWALSRAVLTVPWEIDEARWWVRTADEGTRQSLLDVADQLATLGTGVAIRAAEILFRCHGSKGSYVRANTLSPQPKPLSGFYAFGELTTAQAARSSGIATKQLAIKLSWLALNPTADFDEVRTWRLDELLDSLDPSQIGLRETTSDSLTLEQAEATLCRMAPERVGRFILDVVRRQLDRPPSDTARPYLLEEVFILLEPSDLERVRALQADLDQSAPAKDNDLESELAGIWLASLRGEQQLAFLLSRRREFDSAEWSELLEPLSPEQVRQMISALEHASGVDRRRLLWFAWNDGVDLREDDRAAIRAAANDPVVGTVAAFPPQHASDSELLLGFIEDRHFDDALLSRLLARWAWVRAAVVKSLPRVRNHIGLASETWILAERGSSPEEVLRWTTDMDEELRSLHGSRIVGGDGQYSTALLSRALDVAPAVLDKWIDAVLSVGALGLEITDMREGLLEGLVLSLIDRNDPRGERVIQALRAPAGFQVGFTDSLSRVPSISFWAFKATKTTVASNLVSWMLEQALTNEEIQQVTYAAHLYNRGAWLREIAETITDSNLGFRTARDLMVAGLGGYDAQVLENLEERARGDKSWVSYVAEQAHADLQLDGWAQHWFRAFLRAPSRPEAWAAFRLFLQCVDRRWWLWKNSELEAAREEGDYEVRVRHLVLNLETVKRRIAKRIDQRKAKLFDREPPAFDMVPWKRGWRI